MENNVMHMKEYLDKREQRMVLDFITELTQLEPIELLGAAHMLNVNIYETNPDNKPGLDEAQIRPIDTIIIELLDNFDALSYEHKKNMLKLLKGKLR